MSRVGVMGRRRKLLQQQGAGTGGRAKEGWCWVMYLSHIACCAALYEGHARSNTQPIDVTPCIHVVQAVEHQRE